MFCSTDDMTKDILAMASDEQEAMVIMGDFNVDPARHPNYFQHVAQR